MTPLRPAVLVFTVLLVLQAHAAVLDDFSGDKPGCMFGPITHLIDSLSLQP